MHVHTQTFLPIAVLSLLLSLLLAISSAALKPFCIVFWITSLALFLQASTLRSSYRGLSLWVAERTVRTISTSTSALSDPRLNFETSSSAMDPQEYFKSLNSKTVKIVRARNGLRLKPIPKLSRPAQDQLATCRERWEKCVIC
jgi:hypothetical protein